jgi:hypothetical protein
MTGVIWKHDAWVKPPPAAISIRNGPSEPENAHKPSFLTSLPPELRIEVYKWLFERYEPIIYDGQHRTKDREPVFLEVLEMCGERLSEEELMSLQKPSHDIGPCIAMLRTCRQVYFEAAGIVYGANTFLITVNLQQHNDTMSQFNMTERFLDSLETQISLLNKVVVDTSPLCPDHCTEVSSQHVAAERIDILPLVRILWFKPEVAGKIRLHQTDRSLDRRVHWDGNGSVNDIEPLLLENIIRAIGHDDVLGLKKVGRFVRLLESIWIERCLPLEWGWVVNPMESHDTTSLYLPQADREIVTPFEISKSPLTEPVTLAWQTWADDHDLSQLSRHITDLIWLHAVVSGADISFDMDSQAVQGLDFGLLHLNKRSRRFVQSNLSVYKSTTILCRTKLQRTDFDDWKSFRQWIANPISAVYPTVRKHPNRPEPSATIVLDFTIRYDSRPIELRVNMTNFIRVTFELCTRSLITFRVERKIGGARDESTINLQKLRKRCFLLLSHIMKIDPGLWVNGYGEIVEACDAVSTSDHFYIINPHANLSDIDVRRVGLANAEALEERSAPKYQTMIYGSSSKKMRSVYAKLNYALRKQDTLRAMWVSLKDLDWAQNDDLYRI